MSRLATAAHCALFALVAASLVAASASAAVVTTTADAGPGSLRDAIASAPAGETIEFGIPMTDAGYNSATGVYTIALTSGMLTIDKNITIAGPGANQLVISGTGVSRVFQVNSGATVTIEGVTVANGAVANSGGYGGGGIANAGALTISNCIVSDNIANPAGDPRGAGGGIFNTGVLSILNSAVVRNTVSGAFESRGGGISNENGAMTITNSTVSDNAAIGGASQNSYGGGVWTQGPVTISGSTVDGNSCSGSPGGSQPRQAFGGGIANIGGALTIVDSTVSRNRIAGVEVVRGAGVIANGTTNIVRSTIHGNSLSAAPGALGGGGGGMYIYGGTVLTVTNGTITANSVNGGRDAVGGGIFSNFGSMHLTGVTVSENVVSGGESVSSAGGIFALAFPFDPPRLHCRNTIVAGNSGTAPDIQGTVNSLGHLLIGNTSGTTITGDSTTVISNVDARLGTLDFRGGSTPTMTLLPGSPAIDAGGEFTTLATAIDASTTTITVANANPFPANVGFVLRIGSEQMVITAKTGNTLSVVRGMNGTAAAAHPSGAGVNPVYDQRGAPRKSGNALDIGAVETNYAFAAGAGSAQSTSVGSPFGTRFTVLVSDAGRPAAGIAVTFTAPATGPSGSFADGTKSVTVLTDSNGVATSPAFTANAQPGSYSIVATVNGTAITIPFELSNEPGPVTHFSLTAPASATARSPFEITVVALDRFENTVPSYTGKVRFSSSDAAAILPADATLTNGTATFSVVFNTGGMHTISVGDNADPLVSATSAPIEVIVPKPAKLLNIATRTRVLGGDNVMIAGFIVSGPQPKKIILRATGPSLTVPGAIPDTIIELFDGSGNVIASNDDWKKAADGTSQQDEIERTGVAPQHDLESALIATVPAGGAFYTAIVSGKDGSRGISVVEAYDLNNETGSSLANISTRGFVDTGDNVMIGGIIVGGGDNGAGTRVIVRAIGPSLPVSGKLENPVLKLYDRDGAILASNDDWKESQQSDIEATGVSPSHERESAILRALSPGTYTAIVSGSENTTGVGLVEVYNLGQ